MVTPAVLDQYELTIGIECHVQFKTKTKLFAAVGNDAREADPNTLVTPLCFGLPGVLPVLNEEAVQLAIRAGIALNAEVALFSKFDRKHYFYPDLPLGYQITQYDQPTVGKGSIEVPLGDTTFTVGITRAHLEADAGKSMHPAGKDYSLVDLNRAGTPLLEIVSEPDMHSAAQARAYAEELYHLMKYAEVSDVDLYHGNMRFDVNVSVAKKGSVQLGTRTETKNLNSFRAVERAVEYEYKRQVELLEKGEAIAQETRGWDEAKQRTTSQRSKEEAPDYRYFPDPDLPPIALTAQQIQTVRDVMPPLPPQLRLELAGLGLIPSIANTLLAQPKLLDLQLAVMKTADGESAKRIANWLTGTVQRAVSEPSYDWSQFSLNADQLLHLSQLFDEGKLSSTAAKEVLLTMLSSTDSPQQLAEAANLLQVSDEGELEAAVDQVIKGNPRAVTDFQAGETKVLGFLTGQVMKTMQGRANPPKVQELLRQKLSS